MSPPDKSELDAAAEPLYPTGTRVRVVVNSRNRTARAGQVMQVVWHHKHGCWVYWLTDDRGRKVSKRYFGEDLEPDG